MARSDRRRRASNLARLRHVDRAPGQAISEEDRIAGNPTEPVIIPPVFRTVSRLAAISSLVLYRTVPRRSATVPPTSLMGPVNQDGGILRCTSGRAIPPPGRDEAWFWGLPFHCNPVDAFACEREASAGDGHSGGQPLARRSAASPSRAAPGPCPRSHGAGPPRPPWMLDVCCSESHGEPLPLVRWSRGPRDLRWAQLPTPRPRSLLPQTIAAPK